jgi:hypothetical protein
MIYPRAADQIFFVYAECLCSTICNLSSEGCAKLEISIEGNFVFWSIEPKVCGILCGKMGTFFPVIKPSDVL